MGTREKVLQCAADMFSDKPYGKVSLREIGRAAGVNPSAIYYYFGNKEKLYQVVEQCMPYIGYPRTLNAMSIIDEVVANVERKQ